MSHNFRVGQKVVCIANIARWPAVFNYPEKGQVYTVRAIDLRGDGPGILLKEVRNRRLTFVQYGGMIAEPCFGMECFRPPVEKSTETGMAILRKLLENVPAKERVFTVEMLEEAVRKAKAGVK